MKTLVLTSLAALAAAASAAAQAPAPGGPPPAPPRARGPSLALALEAAQTAVATCLANGYRTTALVVDAAGVPVVLLSGDGAPERTQTVAATKAAAVIRYKAPSGDIADRVKTDPALDAEVKADPKIGTARRGALPIRVGDDLIGALAVSGAPGGDKDEACARPALERIAARLN